VWNSSQLSQKYKERCDISMASNSKPRKKIPPPAATPEAREQQLISYAVDLAEQQLINGTASAQVISHYLRLGSIKDALEKDIMREQRELMRAKTSAIKASQRTEEMFEQAMRAMKFYAGDEDHD
jgi:hypothetical protein